MAKKGEIEGMTLHEVATSRVAPRREGVLVLKVPHPVRPAFIVAAAFLLSLAACEAEEDAGLAGLDEVRQGSSKSRKLDGTIGGSPVPSSGPSSVPSPASSANAGVNIGAGIANDDGTPLPLPTLPPAVIPQATPTPFGLAGQEVGFPGEGLALAGIGGLPFPLILTRTGTQELGANGLAGTRLGSPISTPVAIAGDIEGTSRQAWVASTAPAHLDRLVFGMNGFAFQGSVSLPATPSAVAAGADAVWAALEDGRIFRVTSSALALTSFSVTGKPSAIALGNSRVWVTTHERTLFELDRADGTVVATSSTGPDPVDVTVDAAGTVWVACAGDGTVIRRAGGKNQVLTLDTPPRALIADSRRIWIAVQGGVANLDLAGQRETPDVSLRFSPVDLARDGQGRIWALGTMGQTQWIWPLKAGEG